MTDVDEFVRSIFSLQNLNAAYYKGTAYTQGNLRLSESEVKLTEVLATSCS